MPERNRRRDSAGAERLALLARQDRAPAQHRGRARRRVRPAADLSQHAGRPGRTGVRRRLVRAQRRPQRRRAASDLPRSRGVDRVAARGRRLALRRRADGQAGRERQDRLRRLRAGAARLRRQERLQGRGAGAVRRHRFRAVRGDGGGCARRRPRALRHAAVPLHLAGFARRRRRDAPRRSACSTTSCRSSSAVLGLEKALEPAFAGPAARRHRGEPPGARARRDPDGDLQQVRPDGGDDRQQVGNVGRLRHALRRHERRLQSGQGPLQDRGVSAVAAAQRLEAGGRARARAAR